MSDITRIIRIVGILFNVKFLADKHSAFITFFRAHDALAFYAETVERIAIVQSHFPDKLHTTHEIISCDKNTNVPRVITCYKDKIFKKISSLVSL